MEGANRECKGVHGNRDEGNVLRTAQRAKTENESVETKTMNKGRQGNIAAAGAPHISQICPPCQEKPGTSSLPVLSEQITEQQPKVSTAGSFRTFAFLLTCGQSSTRKKQPLHEFDKMGWAAFGQSFSMKLRECFAAFPGEHYVVFSRIFIHKERNDARSR